VNQVLSARIDFVVTIAAINGLTVAGFEGYFTALTAIRANGREHLSYGPVGAKTTAVTGAISLLLFSGGAAGGATLRLIGVAFGCEKVLLARRKGECSAAIEARDGFVLKTHMDDLFHKYLVSFGHPILESK
jgi:hypothetical protein